jgi:voltage-gated potassium channel
MENKRKFALIILFFIAVIVIGVVGYMRLLDVGFVDALYMTAITISTVGYGEVGEMTAPAKMFSIWIIFSGLAVVGFGVTSLATLFFEGGFKDAWRKKRMEAKINELKDHYIICGAGEVGQTVIKCFSESSSSFVVIDDSGKRTEELKQEGILTVLGDATHEDTLEKARIRYAKGIVCTLSTDADNVFTVLTARQMNDKIYIVSKAIDKSTHNKLLKAGANKTISPNEIGGQRMASLIIRPSVISFLDVITRAGDITLDLEEVEIFSKSSLVGKKLFEAKIPEQTGLIILALKRKGEKRLKFNPSSSETLNAGDTMVVLGTKEQVDQLSALVHK